MYRGQAKVIYQLAVRPSFWMDHPEFLLKIRVSFRLETFFLVSNALRISQFLIRVNHENNHH